MSTSRSKSVSPLGGASSSSPAKDSNAKFEKAFLRLLTKDEDEDSKSIKIPAFSDGTEWESVVFELEVNLEKAWKYGNKMDINEQETWNKFIIKGILRIDIQRNMGLPAKFVK